MPDIFKPLWMRLALAVFAVGWAAFEFYDGSVFWGVLFGVFGVYTAYGVWTEYRTPPVTPKAATSQEAEPGGDGDPTAEDKPAAPRSNEKDPGR